MARPQPLTPDDVRREVDEGRIDTVAVAITDMQGRLQGKRIDADYFVDEVMTGYTEGCNYLMAVDVDMNTVDGYAMSSWDSGYGDMVMRPDLSTLHRNPWQPGTVGVLCDLETEEGDPVAASPRQILRKQLDLLTAAGYGAFVGTELEFIVFQDTYEEAWLAGYRDLTPANLYNVDYSMLGTARVEPLLRRIRNAMTGAGMIVESAKGECNLGQHEIAFKYEDALRTCDNHVIYKNGAKEIAAQEGMALTFMAKYNEREGNSCHIHLSFRGTDGSMVMADHHDEAQGLSDVGTGVHRRPAGARARAHPDVRAADQLLQAVRPRILRPDRDPLGPRQPHLRLPARRATASRCGSRTACPAATSIPTSRSPGMVAAGLDGIERRLPLEEVFVGNAYADDSERVPSSMGEALEAWESSEWIRETFGEEVQDHYSNMARIELADYGRTVTDWERYRSFERL